MREIRVHFHRSSTLMSRLIQWRTGSIYSHVSVEIKDHYYHAFIERAFFKTKERYSDIALSFGLKVSEETLNHIEQRLDEKLGTKYDLKSLFGFVINAKRQNKDRLFCSEVALIALEEILGVSLRGKRLLSPGDIALICQTVYIAQFSDGVLGNVTRTEHTE